jgi:hypothetical protein
MNNPECFLPREKQQKVLIASACFEEGSVLFCNNVPFLKRDFETYLVRNQACTSGLFNGEPV